jgi:hypothetical protein
VPSAQGSRGFFNPKPENPPDDVAPSTGWGQQRHEQPHGIGRGEGRAVGSHNSQGLGQTSPKIKMIVVITRAAITTPPVEQHKAIAVASDEAEY